MRKTQNMTGALLPVAFLLPVLLLASSVAGCSAMTRPADHQQPGTSTTQPSTRPIVAPQPAQPAPDVVGAIITAIGQAGGIIAPAAPQVGGPMLIGAALGSLLYGFFKNRGELNRIKTLWDGNDRAVAGSAPVSPGSALPAPPALPGEVAPARARAGFNGDAA